MGVFDGDVVRWRMRCRTMILKLKPSAVLCKSIRQEDRLMIFTKQTGLEYKTLSPMQPRKLNAAEKSKTVSPLHCARAQSQESASMAASANAPSSTALSHCPHAAAAKCAQQDQPAASVLKRHSTARRGSGKHHTAGESVQWPCPPPKPTQACPHRACESLRSANAQSFRVPTQSVGAETPPRKRAPELLAVTRSAAERR